MGRVSEYDDWCDDTDAILSYGRWQRNSRAVLVSKRGQKALREIEAALLALPEPKLAYETFHRVEDGKVECCVLGAVAAHRGVDMPEHLNGDVDEWTDHDGKTYIQRDPCPAEETASWAEKNLGLAFTLAYNLVDVNDRDIPETDEQRYERVLAWVQKHIKRTTSDLVSVVHKTGDDV